jgi:hypothetical protein
MISQSPIAFIRNLSGCKSNAKTIPGALFALDLYSAVFVGGNPY